MTTMATVITATIAALLLAGSLETSKIVINVIGLFPTSENVTEGVIGRGVLPAVQLAVDMVNQNKSLLQDYELRMHKDDTQCDMAVATKVFFDIMSGDSTNAMLFGDACWEVTGPLAQISKWWNMTMLSYADTNPILSNRKTYPNFYRTVPSDNEFNPARIALLRHYTWKRVGTIYQHVKSSSSSRYSYAHAKLERLLERDIENVSIKRHSFSDDPYPSLQHLKDEDIRIILGNFSPKMARKVFCAAYHKGLYGPKHQWIILGGYPDGWWRERDDEVNCTASQLEDAAHGYIATDVEPVTTSTGVTESGLTPAKYVELYNNLNKTDYSKYHGYAFDGVWVLAEALDRIIKEDNVLNRSREDLNELFRGTNLQAQLNATDFYGVTGKVKFQNGDRLGEIRLEQFQRGKMVNIGVYRQPKALNLVRHRIIWRTKNNMPPRDRSEEENITLRIGVAIYSGLTVLSLVGILMAICFLTVNIYFRQHRYIKMSSPNMNNLIIVGCLLTYISVILLGSDGNVVSADNFHHMCAARAWVMSVGFTLAFGAMFGKTWRVHAIFTNIKLSKKVIKDYKLFMIVGILLLMDAIILTLWQVIDPLKRAEKKLKSETKGEIVYIHWLEFCTSSHMTTWLVIVYVYKGILLVIGCFFAWETRHVSIPALNDSKYIGMSVYNVVILCLCGAAVSFIINDQPTSAFTIVGLFIIFCSTITLCLVFVPKVIELKRDPKGEEKRVRATLSKTIKKVSEKTQAPLSEKIKQLLDENSNYRAVLDDKTREMRELLMQLGEDVSVYEYKSPVNKVVMSLRETNNSHLSPSRTSRFSTNIDDDNGSIFSETSVTHLWPSESPEHSRLKSYIKTRTGNDDSLCGDTSELNDTGKGYPRNRGVAPSSRAVRETAAASRDKFDPFGGVYLGPADDDEVEPPPAKTANAKTREEYPIIHEVSSENLTGHSEYDTSRTVMANVSSSYLPGQNVESSTRNGGGIR